MNERKYYVYEHWRPDRGECFYVGKGHGRRAHDLRRGRNKWHQFIQAKLSRLGTAIEVKIIADGLSESEAFDFEIARIAFWKNDGADLCNLSSGGDGPSGFKHTEEWKRANNERLKNRILSSATRKKLSAVLVGNKRSVGQKKTEKQVRSFREKCIPKGIETILKRAEERRGKPMPWLQTPEVIAKRAAYWARRKALKSQDIVE